MALVCASSELYLHWQKNGNTKSKVIVTKTCAQIQLLCHCIPEDLLFTIHNKEKHVNGGRWEKVKFMYVDDISEFPRVASLKVTIIRHFSNLDLSSDLLHG